MNFRDTIIHVLNQIASDKRMQNRADYWARICGDAATLLKEDELAIERAMKLQQLGHINTPNVMNNTNVLKNCPFCGGEAYMARTYRNYIVLAKHDDNCPLFVRPIPYDTHWATREAACVAWNRRMSDETTPV